MLTPINRVLKTTRPDLIHAQMPTPLTRGVMATLLKRMTKIPLVIDLHDLWSDPSIANLPHQYASKAVVKYVCANADSIIVASRRLANLLRTLGFEQLFLVPNGVDTDLFNPNIDPSLIRQKFGWDSDKHVIVYVGAITQQSGLETLVRASKILLRAGHTSIRFLIVGDGQKRPFLQASVNEAGLTDRWVFTGPVLHQFVPMYIASADVCVAPYMTIPSISAGSSMKAPEYLACGRPLVFSGIDPAISESEACIHVRSGDPEALATAIQTLIDDTQLRSRMGEKGWNYVKENLSWDMLGRTIIDAYRQALGS